MDPIQPVQAPLSPPSPESHARGLATTLLAGVLLGILIIWLFPSTLAAQEEDDTLGCQKVGLDVNAPINPDTGFPWIDCTAGDEACRQVDEAQARLVRLNFLLGPWSSPDDGAPPPDSGLNPRSWTEVYDDIVNGFVNDPRDIEIYALVGHEAMAAQDRECSRFLFRCPVAGGCSDPPPTPAECGTAEDWIARYVDHFARIVELYQDRIQLFETFNEPDDWRCDGPTWCRRATVHPSWFAEMIQALQERREADDWGEVRVLSGPLFAHDANGDVFTQFLRDAHTYGVNNLEWESFPVDGFGLHLYVAAGSHDAPTVRSALEGRLSSMKTAISGFNQPVDRRGIYISELGWQSSAVTEEGQASNLREAFDVLRSDSQVERAIWFSRSNFLGCPENPGNICHWGLYTETDDDGDGQNDAKPSRDAFAEQTCPLDLGLSIDGTGSMADDIDSVKTASEQILLRLLGTVKTKAATTTRTRMAVTDFRDFPRSPYGDPTDFPYRVVHEFSSDPDSLGQAIQTLGADGGNDWPESIYSGLLGAIEGVADCTGRRIGLWRHNANKALILLGDAPPHEPEPFTGLTLSDVLFAAAAGGNQGGPAVGPCPPAMLSSPPPPVERTGAGLAERIGSPASPIRIYTIHIGGDPAARAYFRLLAEGTGGRLFTARSAEEVVPALLEAIGAATGTPANSAPDTSGAEASLDRLWPPSHGMRAVTIVGVSDPDGDPVTLTVTGITQDEPVSGPGSGSTAPDGDGVGGDRAFLRAERSGTGNGRVYRVSFTASDGKGGSAPGAVFVCVPHDRHGDCVDDGQLFDSTQP